MAEGRISSIIAESSIPGFSKFGSFSSRLARTVWCLILFLSFIGCIVHTAILVERFFRFETVTQTVLNEEPFIFPDVTICNNFPLNHHRSKANLSINNQVFTGDELLHAVKNFWKSLRNISASEINKYTRTDNRETRYTYDRFTRLFDMPHHLDEFMLKCKFAGKPCSFKHFVEFQYPFYQKCWTFRPPFREVNAGGPKNGLRLVAYVGDRRAFLTDEELLNWLRGVVVVFHGPNTMPIPQDGSLVAANGMHTTVELQMTKSVRMSHQNSHCIQPSVDSDITFAWKGYNGSIADTKRVPYTTEACEELEMQKPFIQQCGCLSELYPVKQATILNSSIPYCHELSLSLLMEPEYSTAADGSVLVKRADRLMAWVNYFAWRRDETTEIERRLVCHRRVANSAQSLVEKANSSACPRTCEIRAYHPTTSSYDWPESVVNAEDALSKMLKERLETMEDPETYEKALHRHLQTIGSMRFAFLKFDVYPKSPKGTLIKESRAYPLSAAFSDFGGVLGLWMGVSIITIIEIITSCCSIARSPKDKDEQDGEDTRREGQELLNNSVRRNNNET